MTETFNRIANFRSDVIKTLLIEKGNLKNSEIETVTEAIRRIRPQSRGSVVTSGGKILPLSGSKKLNLQNTPVILVRKDSAPIYVFPCKVGETFYSVHSGIAFLERNLPETPNLFGEIEQSLLAIISRDPNKIELGLKFDSSEFTTRTGQTDVVLRDEGGKYLVIEVERQVSDSALGQILRLSEGFELDHHLSRHSVRSGIVCYRANKNVLAACSRAGVEVWIFHPDEQQFRKEV